ncbi:MAG: riboflavin biosynthesis protein RibF [Candidatus Eiseniibacteriota bacterium]|nr:MAG: riboflavin biosynthesis protein RibF [Candidatus Eisenbacteria bacterium]
MDRGNPKGSVATVGVFDGVHVGHARVLEIVSERARTLGLSAAVLTFDPHPDQVLGKLKEERFLLTTPQEKHALLLNLGVDVELVLEFTPAMGLLDAASFVKKYLQRSLHVKELVIGHDFRMGRDREGDRDQLRSLGQECGFSVLEVDAVVVDGHPVSSTRARHAVCSGDVGLAARLLGRGYSLESVVVPGEGIGTKLGFPTANLSPDERKLLPADGVYAGYAETGGRSYRAAINVGTSPTVGRGERRVEAHLVGLKGVLLGEQIRLTFAARIRPERKFSGLEDLRKAIKKDVAALRHLLETSSVSRF